MDAEISVHRLSLSGIFGGEARSDMVDVMTLTVFNAAREMRGLRLGGHRDYVNNKMICVGEADLLSLPGVVI